MNSRERIYNIIADKERDRYGFWLGTPHFATWPKLQKFFNTNSQEEIRQSLNDDIRHICPQFYLDAYKHPEGKSMFPPLIELGIPSDRGYFADCDDVQEVEDYDWPNPDYLNFDQCLRDLETAGDIYRLSGMWSCFYHNVMDFFSMENYMIKMYDHPEVVDAVTRHVCEFYLEANERFFELDQGLIDGFFFGNDFGTQQDLICSPEHFDRFIRPWFNKFTEQGRDHGYQVILHSCGAIHRVIDPLIAMGVDCLHPLQAIARDMDAETLARDFKGRVTFFGCIDTQDLLVRATPEQVKTEVRRVKSLLGPNLIVSPSHEALLPDVPPENILAMAEAAVE